MGQCICWEPCIKINTKQTRRKHILAGNTWVRVKLSLSHKSQRSCNLGSKLTKPSLLVRVKSCKFSITSGASMLFVLPPPFKIEDTLVNKMALGHVAGNWGIMMLSPLRTPTPPRIKRPQTCACANVWSRRHDKIIIWCNQLGINLVGTEVGLRRGKSPLFNNASWCT